MSGFKRDLRSTEFNQISGTVVKKLWVILNTFLLNQDTQMTLLSSCGTIKLTKSSLNSFKFRVNVFRPKSVSS